MTTENEMLTTAEYLWIDGAKPTQRIRAKTRIVQAGLGLDPSSFPEWGFDGSSTNQAAGDDSDVILQPVRVVENPLREGGYLVLCETYDPGCRPHPTNTRARLRATLDVGGKDQEPWVGFEQEYTLFDGGAPLGFPADGYPEPQGPYYCGVGADRAFGRSLVEAHGEACMRAGLMIYGTNAEVMAGQWEFQIGYRGLSGEVADPLTVSDHLWIARWLLHRIGEDHGIVASFANKPVSGDWNGAGNHTNFSTRAMREIGGIAAIRSAILALQLRHGIHVAEYGAGLSDRLTGLHETCSIDEFRGGVADRGASIRIPRQVAERGRGYLEDRRPGANADPYRVTALLIETICGADARAADADRSFEATTSIAAD
jgi:glutamine synthetase